MNLETIIDRLARLEEKMAHTVDSASQLTQRIQALEGQYKRIERLIWLVIAGLGMNKIQWGDIWNILSGML